MIHLTTKLDQRLEGMGSKSVISNQ